MVYITSPNLFALFQYSLGNTNVTLLPETAKIEFVLIYWLSFLLNGVINELYIYYISSCTSFIFVDLKETVLGYMIYTAMNLSTVTYIALVCGSTDILYLSTIYFGIFYMQRISRRLSDQTMSHESLKEFAIYHNTIITIFKRIQKLSKTFMLIMYFSNLSMTCFIGLVLTTVRKENIFLINLQQNITLYCRYLRQQTR